MALQYIQISGEEFIRRFANGERDFRGIALPEGGNLTIIEGYDALENQYDEPISLEDSRLVGLVAQNINLKNSDLRNVNLRNARLSEVTLNMADLSGAFLNGADLEYSKLCFVNFKDADLSSSNLNGADLTNAKNLASVKNLHLANIVNVKTDSENRKIIEEVYAQRKLFAD